MTGLLPAGAAAQAAKLGGHLKVGLDGGSSSDSLDPAKAISAVAIPMPSRVAAGTRARAIMTPLVRTERWPMIRSAPAAAAIRLTSSEMALMDVQ